MKVKKIICLASVLALLIACSPVKTGFDNQYQLTAFSTKRFGSGNKTILVATPNAAVSLQTNQMWYVNKPFERLPFAKNSWVTPPADMLYPLLVRSIQASGHFYAVTSSPYSEQTDYRLDTQVLQLEQNFLTKPSRLIFSAKVVLSDSNSDEAIASKVFTIEIPCPGDTPYGGVQAANKASSWFTAKVAQFVVSHV